jgi:outer membrane protein TolC
MSSAVIAMSLLAPAGGSVNADAPQVSWEVLTLSLDACIDTALVRNQRRQAAKQGVEAALAVRGQAKSLYWPRIDAVSSLSRRDEDPLFVFPAVTDARPEYPRAGMRCSSACRPPVAEWTSVPRPLL